MNSHKSAFLGLALGALVLGVTACEDKATDINLPPPAVEISITPTGPINLQVGQTANVTANVTGGDANTVRTVTYSSSNASVASVSGNTITAVAPGTATITATNAANSLTASVQVIVSEGQAPPVVDQPTISIKSVTTGTTNTPVNINNVFGQIDITLNVEIPAGNNIDSLTVKIGNETVCKQVFTGGTLGGSLGIEAAQAQAEIVCSVNTAEFNAATGDPRFPNGQYEVSAQLYRATGTIAASTATTLIFNNVSHFVMAYTTSGGMAQNSVPTLAPAGSNWTAGSVTVTLTPVIFTGASDDVATATITLNSAAGANATSAACGATTTVPACPAFSVSRTGTAGGNGIITVTFPTSGSNNVGSVEGIFTFAVSGAITTGGQAGPTCVNPDPVRNPTGTCVAGGTPLFANPLRLDNLAPRFVSIDMIKTDPTNSYFNGSVTFSHTAQGTAASSTDGRAVTIDWGVDDQTATFQAGAPGSLIPVTSTADLPESTTSTTFVLQVTTVDDLGNSRSGYATTTNTVVNTSATAGTTLRFGIDKTAPTLAVTPNADIINSVPTNLWTFNYSDSGIGPSGFPTAGQIRLTLKRINSAGTTCVLGSGSSCTRAAQTIVPGGTLAYDNSTGVEGYYLLDAVAQDAAGNDSNVEEEMGLLDITPPLMSGIQAPLTISGGTSVTFTALASDFVELGTLNPLLEYGAAAAFVASPLQTIGTYGPNPLTFEATLTDVHPNFIVSLESTTAGHMPSGTIYQATNAHFNLLDVAGVVEDQDCTLGAAGTNCTQRSEDITAAVAGGTTATPTPIVVTGMTGFEHVTSTVLVDRSSGPTTTTLTVETTGPSQTFAQPWISVEFWFQDGFGVWHRVGGTPGVTATDDTVLMTRTWTHTLTWGPFTAANDGTFPVVAVGVTTNGRALISQPISVTIQP